MKIDDLTEIETANHLAFLILRTPYKTVHAIAEANKYCSEVREQTDRTVIFVKEACRCKKLEERWDLWKIYHDMSIISKDLNESTRALLHWGNENCDLRDIIGEFILDQRLRIKETMTKCGFNI